MGLCGAKQSRRFLILDNLAMAFTGFAFIIVGGWCLTNGKQFKAAVNDFCKVECLELGCSDSECSKRLPSCDCTSGISQISAFWASPAGGLISVGVLSILSSLLGCMGAIKVRASWLCGYIMAVLFILILQFSFGIAAALVADMNHVPEEMIEVFDTKYRDFDWMYLQSFMPASCSFANTTHNDSMVTNHPMCEWDGTCVPALDQRMATACCKADNTCDFHNKDCTSPQKCISGFLYDVGTPVAVCALLTLILEISAIVWACVLRRETRIGGAFDPSRNHL